MNRQSLMKSTPLLDKFNRGSLHAEMDGIERAKREGRPVYEIMCWGQTLDMTPSLTYANKHFGECITATIVIHRAGFKKVFRAKKNGKELSLKVAKQVII